MKTMNSTICMILIDLLFGCLGLCSAAQAQSAAVGNNGHAKRPVTVADVIEMTQVGDPLALASFTSEGSAVKFSPDGSKFMFLVRRGNLKNDTVDYSLLVFRTATALSSPRPTVVATFASSSNREAIAHPTWLQDNDTIVFLGEHPGGHPQMYRVSVTTKEVVQVTSHPSGVLAYSITNDGESFVYLAEASPSSRSTIGREMFHHGFPVTSQRWDEVYRIGQPGRIDLRREVFFKTTRMEMPQRVGSLLTAPDLAVLHQLSISPNGRYALIAAYNLAPPAIWSKYNLDFKRRSTATSCSVTDASSCSLQYFLADLEKETVEPLMNAPVVEASEGRELFAWTQENSLLLVNALLPLDSVDAKERNERHGSVYAAEVLLPGKQIVKIARRQTPFHAFEIQSGTQRDRFVTQSFIATYGPPLEIRREPGGWKVTEASPAVTESADRLSVTLDQDMNSPPRLVANDPQTKRKTILLDLNPEFSQLTFGRVEAFQWKTGDGRPVEGSLYLPPDYVAGRRYPLVIQTHGYSRDRFWPDGPYTTAFAAQPLANRGFLVLQLPIGNPYGSVSTIAEVRRVFNTAAEGPYFAAILESAVDELDRRGLADPSRVGLSGFSRTVYHVLYTLTHSGHHFAAAVAADGVNFGYVGCLYYLAEFASSLCEKVNGGGPPYGDALAGWAKEAPTFRLDRIEAPLLLQAISAPLGEWEILAGLRWLKKPVELLNFYPEGEHELVRPQQRLLSQGSVVDWYCFWLKGEEDADPAKAEQYKRWRELRKLQERANAPRANSLNE